jgi:biotin carboxyl carrier protein
MRSVAKTSSRSRFLRAPKFSFIRERFRATTRFTQRRPIASFIVALVILFGLIAAGNFLFKANPPTTPTGPQVKPVQIYKIGSVPKVATQAQIQNSGVITIVALSPGVVQTLHIQEGEQVYKDTNLITLSSNYAGGNAPAIQQSIAFKQLQQINDTFKTQKEIIQKSREIANATQENTTQLKDISARSVVDLQAIADLNQNMLDSIKQNLANLAMLPTAPDTQAAILQAKSTQNQLQMSQNQIHQQLINTQYQVNPSNPPTQLANLQKDITLKQLDIQEKSLQTSKDIAGLQVALSAINTSLLHPTAPFNATVEKILVRAGVAVNPGTPLLILSGSSQTVKVVAKVPETLARQVSQIEDSTLHLKNATISAKPSFVSDVATDGLLYSVIYTVPDGFTTNLTDNDYVTVDIPVGAPDTTSTIPFVPLDSIFQTQEHSYLYINQNGTVVSRQVETGDVIGNYVQIVSGLHQGDQVILNRNVVEGDRVTIAP